ncbi:hypothetical protein [Belnapia sp. F-4-1]|uniref:hypothetical protein n=1 Tax=Belnapia sp. F-4-1 TaxID=1545443 RepID=UPI0005BC0E3E|nr:hypothetical protein [Belnapia sp. F-4-1]
MVWRRHLAGLGLALLPGLAAAQGGEVSLFKVVGPRDEVTIGLTEAELARLGGGPAVERLARALVAEGQVTAWRYAVGRAPDGATRFAATGRVAILRSESLRIEPYAAALPVAPPPAE